MPKGATMGFVNVDALRVENNGIERCARYITKYPEKADGEEDGEKLQDLHRRTRGQRRWHQSKGLALPYATYADAKYKPRTFARMLERFRETPFWESLYPGYEVLGCTRERSEITGWSICLRMQRITS